MCPILGRMCLILVIRHILTNREVGLEFKEAGI